MIIWFFFALSSAIANSIYNVLIKDVGSRLRLNMWLILFVANYISAFLLFIAYLASGFTGFKDGFWESAIITLIINFIATPVLFRAYQLGEFSSVYSMLLLTPVFLLATSFLFLGEKPSIVGIAGVLLTIGGLYLVAKNQSDADKATVQNYKMGNILGVVVALFYSVSANFDKLSALHSNQYLAPAVVSLITGIGYTIFWLFSPMARANVSSRGKSSGSCWQNIGILAALGVIYATAVVFYNNALVNGFVSYTIVVKRTGILFGVLWGWLIFREHNITKKLLGVLIALLGVFTMLFLR